jgi:hypothetical protein
MAQMKVAPSPDLSSKVREMCVQRLFGLLADLTHHHKGPNKPEARLWVYLFATTHKFIA